MGKHLIKIMDTAKINEWCYRMKCNFKKRKFNYINWKNEACNYDYLRNRERGSHMRNKSPQGFYVLTCVY